MELDLLLAGSKGRPWLPAAADAGLALHQPESHLRVCRKSDCPRFEVKDQTDDWELRLYDAGKWVVTNVTDTKYEASCRPKCAAS